MTYTKPELVALTHAVEAIQSGGQEKLDGSLDGVGDPPFNHTSPAYEADE